MNTQKVLLGALLAQPDLAPYSLPDLDVEHFAPDVQPVFAAVSGFWNSTGTLDAVQICARYPDRKQPNVSVQPAPTWRSGHKSSWRRQH